MERQIADMTLRMLENASSSGNTHPGQGADRPSTQPQPPRRMPYDPVTDRGDTPEPESYRRPSTSSAATTHSDSLADSHEDLRTSVLKSRADSEARRLLDTLPVRRAWEGRAFEPPCDASRATALEAVMIYERGQLQPPARQCARCRRGQGVSPECVKIHGVRDGACSNCVLSRVAGAGGGQGRASPSRDYSPARRFITASVPASTASEDMVAVWNVIAGVLATQSRDCCVDDAEETTSSARRIEDAALLVARSADEWGHRVEDGDEAASKRRRTGDEKVKLVTQASRIRDTALRIAECAKTWGEKQLAARAQRPPSRSPR